MPKVLREVDVADWFREVHVGTSPAWSLKTYAKGRDLVLGEARGIPPEDLVREIRGVLELDGKRFVYGLPEWGHQCAVHFGAIAGYPHGFSTAWWPMVGQSERLAMTWKIAARAAAIAKGLPDPWAVDLEVIEHRPTDTPNASIPAGFFDVRTRGGYLYCRGSKDMAFLTGCMIPDPTNENITTDTARALGVFRQIFHVYRLLARDILEWKAGHRTVVLYADDDEVAAAKREGRRQQGEIVACKSAIAKVLLKWTPVHNRPDGRPLRIVNGVPWVSVLEKRPAVWKSFDLPGSEHAT